MRAGATIETVVPTWSETITFPAIVRLPVVFHLLINGDKELEIKSGEQPVPAQIVTWMKNDLRYRTWFKSG